MAANGSRKPFTYTTDGGALFAVDLDESIYETAALGFVQTVAAGTTRINVTGTRPVRLRYVNVVRLNSNNETVRNRYWVGTAAALAAIQTAGVLNIDGTSWGVSTTVGEIRQLVPATDTAITDGDVDSIFPA